MLGMNKPILVVANRPVSFSIQSLLSAAEGADAMFITPADRLDSGFLRYLRRGADPLGRNDDLNKSGGNVINQT